MNSRRLKTPAILAAIVFSLALPLTAAAQFGQGPWYRGDRNERRQRRNNDRYERDRYERDRYERSDNYERRALRDAARRLKDRSQDFQRNLDRSLDRSRYDDSNREDRINDIAKEFREATDRLEDRVDDNNRNLSRSASEARRVLQLGARLERVVSRVNLDSRTYSNWSQIRQDLQTISSIYNSRGNYGSDGYYDQRGSYEPRRSNIPWGWPREW